jgi:hypothetical protein
MESFKLGVCALAAAKRHTPAIIKVTNLLMRFMACLTATQELLLRHQGRITAWRWPCWQKET